MDIGTRLTKWLTILNRELSGGSDRSCVISACSIVDHLLGKTLRTFLVPNPMSRDRLFDSPTAPLGSFSARIDMAFRLGLIGHRLSRDLHRLRKIRNDFAHSFDSTTLGERKYQDKVNAVISSLGLEDKVPDMFDKPYNSPRGRFTVCVLLILVHIEHTNQQLAGLKRCNIDGVLDMTISNSKRSNEK